jgi:hypothetical protein
MARKNGWDTLVSRDRQKANGITEETITQSGKAKNNGKKKKEREPGQWGRTLNRLSRQQEHEAQFVRNKANFVTRRGMQKESEVSKMMKKGELDIGEVNKVMSQVVKNKATIIKKTTNKSRGPDEQYHY